MNNRGRGVVVKYFKNILDIITNEINYKNYNYYWNRFIFDCL